VPVPGPVREKERAPGKGRVLATGPEQAQGTEQERAPAQELVLEKALERVPGREKEPAQVQAQVQVLATERVPVLAQAHCRSVTTVPGRRCRRRMRQASA
jgi:protein tyrosine phosphatase (PTP) superfamily phosphohydrolase (DUF442 family)